MKVACHYDPNSRRSIHLAQAMREGATKMGLQAGMVPNFYGPAGDVGVAYGWGNPGLFDAYRAAGGHFVYLDLGWWGRKPIGAMLDGYHKVVVDGREPGSYFRGSFPGDRIAHHGVRAAPWRASGRNVLLAGLSAKSAGTRGLRPQEWETRTAAALRQLTARPIIYRPKPSWTGATPIPKTIFSGPEQALDAVLRDCWAVVTLHSNVAVDALAAGVPVNVAEGVAREFSTPLFQIENPRMPDGRDHLLADIAYCQWTPKEMANGQCWAHILRHTPLCA